MGEAEINALNDLFREYNILAERELYDEGEEEAFQDIIERILDYIEDLPVNIPYILTYRDENGNQRGITLNHNSFINFINRLRSSVDNIDYYNSGSDAIDHFELRNITNIVAHSARQRVNNDGLFFPYYNISGIDLTRQQIYSTKKEINNDTEHCLIYALRMSELFTEEEILELRLEMVSHLCKSYLKQIGDRLKCNIILKEYLKNTDKSDKKNYTTGYAKTIELGLYENHYFLNEILPIHLWGAKNFNSELFKNNEQGNKIYKLNGDKTNPSYSDNFKTKAISIIRAIKQNNGFVPLKIKDFLHNQNVQKLHKELILLPKCFNYDKQVKLNEEKEINYEWKYCNREKYDLERSDDLQEYYNKFRLNDITGNYEYEDKIIPKHVKYNWENHYSNCGYGDFETITDTPFHEGFISGFVFDYKQLQNIMVTNGESCIITFLNNMPDNSLVYFHNLKYDWQQIQGYVGRIVKMVEQDNQLFEVTCYYKQKRLTFRDSYKMIPLPLRDFTKVFGLKNIEKDVMPYKLYTKENIKKASIPIEEGKSYFQTEEDKKEFERLIMKYKVFNPRKPTMFYHQAYAMQYCKQDVNVLASGFNEFRKMILETIDMDVFNYSSLPGLADQYFIKKGCYDGVYFLTGTVRKYVQESIVGGRVMSKDNKTWKLQEDLDNLDANSLYPSAMTRIPGFPKGKPKLLTNFCWDYVKNLDHFVVEIKITNVREKFDLPMFSYISDNGNRVWSNDIPPKNLIVNKIDLEDYIKYHKIDFQIISGIYWNEGFNNTINFVINDLYNMRKKYKQEGNKLEFVIKLLLNSAYGKTILKERPYKNIYLKSKLELENYISKNMNKVIDWVEIKQNASKDKKYEPPTNYVVKVFQSLYNHTNRAHCGGMILSMSKRIMNEMVYASKLAKCTIYYSDCDSAQLTLKNLQKTKKIYKELYGREMIGEELGQFKSEFAIPNCKKVKSVESVFLCPKTYCHKLIGIDKDTGEEKVKYYFRCKGVSTKSMLYVANKKYNGSVLDVYKSNKKLEFDLLCDDQIKFEYVKGIGIRDKQSFTRTIDFRSQ